MQQYAHAGVVQVEPVRAVCDEDCAALWGEHCVRRFA